MTTDHSHSTSDVRPGQRFIEDVCVGDALPPLVKQPSTTMLFRFSAVTWNAHRIHYDQAYANLEKHPGVLVQATMHGAFVIQMLNAFAGPAGRILRLDYSNRGVATSTDTLFCEGTITAIDAGLQQIDCDIVEHTNSGRICVRGTARLFLPHRPNAN